MKKSILFAVVAVFLGLILWITVVIYQPSNKYLANKTPISKSKETGIENNAGRFVWDAGNVYYWEYKTQSFDNQGYLAQYNPKYTLKNKLICLQKNGKKKTIIQTNGYGPIAVYQDEIYFQKINKHGNIIIYSIKKNGKNQKNYGSGLIKAMDHNSEKLICCNVDGQNKIFSIDCKNGTKKVLTSNGKFLEFNEDKIYFQDFDAVKNKDAMEGSVALKSIKSTGKNKVTIAITKPDLYKDSSKCLCQITQIQIEKDNVYFSYGGYSGTAGFYQGGIIARVSKNGTDYKVLAGKDDNIPSDRFYIKNTKSGKYLIYLISGNDNSPTVSINLKNGDTKQTDFLVYKRGEPFKDGSYVSIYLDDSGKKSILLKKIDYEDMGDYAQLREEMGETYFSIYDVETVHNKVYYTAEFSKHNSKLDSGWRYGYDRIKTNVYCKDIDTAKKKLLYTY